MSRTTAANDLRRDIESYVCGETPSAMELHRAPVINHWKTEVVRTGKEFKLVVRGQVSGNLGFRDGDAIGTPAVVWFDRNARFIRTYHGLFVLGEPAEINVDEEA